MKLRFQKATLQDIDLLVSTRMEVLQAVSDGYGEPLHPNIKAEVRGYFESQLNTDYVGYFVYHEEELVGCGGICFTQIIPTLENPTGKGAVVVNMYTLPPWRGKGIAYQLLDVLVQEAIAHNVDEVTLESTPTGHALYKRYGFVKAEEAMSLPYEKLKRK